jgi:predicted dehydrogenase
VKVLVVGLGVQGQKRRRVAGEDCIGSVDPARPEATYRSLEEVPPASFDAALVCTPDEPKVGLLRYLLGSGKHVLVEKPLFAGTDEEILELQRLARAKGVVCYTAYNHRFEPHFVRMRELLASGRLGRVYRGRLFYGNGTARLVRESAWRDTGAGVLLDLGSHLLDTCRFWFGDAVSGFRVVSADRFENRAPDHVVLTSEGAGPRLELEMTLLMWRNHFTADILAEEGSAHIRSLCKWGPSTFTHRTRVLPSGRPPEEAVTLVSDDPTWEIEYRHFQSLCASGATTDLSTDVWLNGSLRRLAAQTQTERAS